MSMIGKTKLFLATLSSEWFVQCIGRKNLCMVGDIFSKVDFLARFLGYYWWDPACHKVPRQPRMERWKGESQGNAVSARERKGAPQFHCSIAI